MKFLYAVVFDKELYPDYSNKGLNTTQGSFPCHDAKTFVFSDESRFSEKKDGDYQYEAENIKALDNLLVITKETITKKKAKRK